MSEQLNVTQAESELSSDEIAELAEMEESVDISKYYPSDDDLAVPDTAEIAKTSQEEEYGRR